MHSNNYILLFVTALTLVVAVVLAALFSSLKPMHDANEAIYNKKAILMAIKDHLGADPQRMSGDDITAIFNDQIDQFAIDMDGNIIDGLKAEDIDMKKEKKKPEAERRLPLYVFKKGGEKKFIISVRGNGLWDEIWGCIALEEDLNTVSGVSFDHQGETPGLGAEIKDNPAFPAQFVGEQIYEEDGDYVSIEVEKGGSDPLDKHAVDAISGATITCDGVSEMLDRGIAYYEPYFKKLKMASGQ